MSEPQDQDARTEPVRDLLGVFIGLVSEAVEAIDSNLNHSGRFRVRSSPGLPADPAGFEAEAAVGEAREPLVDVFDEGQEILVVAEMPGISAEEILVEVDDDILALASTGERRYAAEVLLPAAVAAPSLQRTYRNGILELRMQKL
jgi:HSP20 family protein